jgi:glutaredoxin 3
MTAPLIEMYTTSWCPYCTRAKRLLEHKRASYAELSIEEHPELRSEMIRRSGRRTVPQIFIDGQHIGGSDELAALDEAGGLDRLLSPAPAATQQ